MTLKKCKCVQRNKKKLKCQCESRLVYRLFVDGFVDFQISMTTVESCCPLE